jgi:hypothetical protein
MMEGNQESNPYAVSHAGFSSAPAHDFKVFTLGGLVIAGALGGPFTLTALMLFNAHRLGGRALQWKIVLTNVPVMGAIFALAEVYGYPGRLFEFLLQIALFFVGWILAKFLLADLIDAHRRNGGLCYSNWRAVLIGVCIMMVTMAIFFSFTFLVEYSFPTP